ncbi:hypothetical protein N7517_004555 [Penicillium concentricum]|uniref:Rhodopsin domain-containing protein n=1 Tax=Penicillium concentricum TaxID=293559 RepID=A0A9W9V9H8_9EURO|nr:uncharacterized protein N7517_004555 [Penicillium concentricum]KAJ5372549.1 hypothetical protein N7517_004555 [Penicillium concentricum]
MYVEIVTSIFTGLAALTVALRLYTRFRMVKAAGLDDLIISFALACDVTFYIFILLGKWSIPAMPYQPAHISNNSSIERKYGLGIPTTELSTEKYQCQLYWLWLSVPFYNMTMILAKISALTLFTRVFHPRPFLIITYILMAFLALFGLWTTLSGFVYCVPVHDFWNPSQEVRKKHCLPDAPTWFTNAGIQTFTDLMIVAMPMPLLWKLQLPKRQKWGILVVFSLGICIVATSAGRLYQLNIMVSGGDFTEANAQAALWSSLEANISIICICLPPLHPLLSRIFSYFFLPRPVRSSASKRRLSTKAEMTETLHRDDGIWCNDLFNPTPASYSASISKVDTNDAEETEEGIRVVRELRLHSDSVPPSIPSSTIPPSIPSLPPSIPPSTIPPSIPSMNGPHPDLERGERGRGSIAHENPHVTLSTEQDFGDFEFPDYKDKMNSPV